MFSFSWIQFSSHFEKSEIFLITWSSKLYFEFQEFLTLNDFHFFLNENTPHQQTPKIPQFKGQKWPILDQIGTFLGG